jgi:crotonobetainyl-CoA:carnitine CoA-transferase CaiB-like acyl-CoA transferase
VNALAGVRVVSIALNAPGPLAVARLVAEGATATKIEPPSGDPLCRFCEPFYAELHKNVSVERLDLKSAAGSARVHALLADCDLFVASQRPSALSRLGLTADALTDIRCLNIVGELAHPERPGHDLTYLARAGLLRESMPVSLLADVMGSERAFSAALLLLRQPPGTHTEVGLFDSLDSLLAPLEHGLTAPGGLLGGGLPSYGVYRTKEGMVALAALEPHFRSRLYDALSLELDADLTDVMMTRTATEWERWGEHHDLPIARVRPAAASPRPRSTRA